MVIWLLVLFSGLASLASGSEELDPVKLEQRARVLEQLVAENPGSHEPLMELAVTLQHLNHLVSWAWSISGACA